MGGTAFAFRVGNHDQIPKPPENFPHSCGVFKHNIRDESFAHKSTLSWMVLILITLFI
jgi:hypothetical protein